ncbi:MAG: hypothetical protein GY746_08945, partial [Gammaproteobacteria bacterium]|nr:hypothetical protein [Gammaproteobacteria bacterium]
TGSSITVEGTASSGTTIDTFKCIITDTSDGSFIEDTITVTVLWELSFKEQFYLDNGFHFDDVR